MDPFRQMLREVRIDLQVEPATRRVMPGAWRSVVKEDPPAFVQRAEWRATAAGMPEPKVRRPQEWPGAPGGWTLEGWRLPDKRDVAVALCEGHPRAACAWGDRAGMLTHIEALERPAEKGRGKPARWTGWAEYNEGAATRFYAEEGTG